MMWFSIMLADYRQRTRTRAFWLTLMLTSVITLFLFPAVEASYAVVNIKGYRGIYNSAFIGDSLALLNSMVFPLFGFYLIKNSLYLDLHNKVDAILAASTMDRFNYLLGKWLSNFFVLLTLCLTMSIAALLVQYYRGESHTIDLIALFKPQLILVVPVLLTTAIFAVLFESIKILRGGFGNMLFFFLWTPLLVLQMESGLSASLILNQLENAVVELPFISSQVAIGGIPIDQPLTTFLWQGTTFDDRALISLLAFVIFSLVLFIIAVLFFKRYNPGRLELFSGSKKKKLSDKIEINREAQSKTTLTSLSEFSHGFGIIRLLIGEFRLLTRDRYLWWYIGAIIQVILALILPLESIRSILLPLFGIWSILILSQLGCREYLSNTRVIIAYNMASEQQRLLSVWFAAVFLQLLLAGGLILRLLLEHQQSSVLMLVVACFFIPTLALTLGRITKTPRTFELIYLMTWYLGPMEHIPFADFLGTTYENNSLPIMNFGFLTAFMLTGLLVLSLESIRHRFRLS